MYIFIYLYIYIYMYVKTNQCDFGTWLSRGWYPVEFFILLTIHEDNPEPASSAGLEVR